MFLERVSGLKYCVVSEPGWAATNSSQGMAFKEVVSYREQLTQVAGRVVRDVHGVQHGSSSSTTSTTPSTPSSNNLMSVGSSCVCVGVCVGVCGMIVCEHCVCVGVGVCGMMYTMCV